jgi:hypothetical protein
MAVQCSTNRCAAEPHSTTMLSIYFGLMATIFGTSRSSRASGCFEGLCAIRSSMRTTAIQTTDSTLRFAVTQVTEAAGRWRDIRGRSGRTQPNKRSPWPNFLFIRRILNVSAGSAIISRSLLLACLGLYLFVDRSIRKSAYCSDRGYLLWGLGTAVGRIPAEPTVISRQPLTIYQDLTILNRRVARHSSTVASEKP